MRWADVVEGGRVLHCSVTFGWYFHGQKGEWASAKDEAAWCLYFKVKCCLTQKDSGLREIYGNLAIE